MTEPEYITLIEASKLAGATPTSTCPMAPSACVPRRWAPATTRYISPLPSGCTVAWLTANGYGATGRLPQFCSKRASEEQEEVDGAA